MLRKRLRLTARAREAAVQALEEGIAEIGRQRTAHYEVGAVSAVVRLLARVRIRGDQQVTIGFQGVV